METLANLESFVRSAESASFSEAARRLGMSPAAVSKNVARLESRLGVRLFQRSTRKLTLTEAGERFLGEVRGGMETISGAIANVAGDAGAPAGTLRVSVAFSFGLNYVLPMLEGFCARYPAIVPDWQFDNRQVDLIAEGFDAAIGGGIELTPGVTAREIARAHVIVVASPAYMKGRKGPAHPAELAAFDGVVRRSVQTGRINTWTLRSSSGEQFTPELRTRVVLNDPEAICRGVAMGLGVALAVVPHALPLLATGQLVRLLPDWHAEIGPISLYYAGGKLVPPKTRAFVDYAVEYFRKTKLAAKLSAA